MQNRKRFLAFALIFALCFSLTGCAVLDRTAPDYTKGDSADFVKAVAHAITLRVDDPKLLDPGENAIKYDLETKPTFQPYFAMLDFKAETDADDPALVHYSCRVPGVVGACFNMAYDVCFNANPRYSKWVHAEGSVRVLTDEDGTRRIDISDGGSVFSAYAALRYVNPLFFLVKGISISDGLQDDNFAEGMNILLSRGCDAYAEMLGTSFEEYTENVIIPELEDYQGHMATIVRLSTCEGYGLWNDYYALSNSVKIAGLVIAALLAAGLVALLFAAIRGFFKRIKKDKKKKKARRNMVANDLSAPELLEEVTGFAGNKKNDRAYQEYFRYQDNETGFASLSDARTAAKAAVVLAQKPDDTDEVTLRFLCSNIFLGTRMDRLSIPDEEHTNAEMYRHELLTAAGWSAAAMGRIIAKKMTPDEIARNMERFSIAVDRSNELVGQIHAKSSEQAKIGSKLNGMKVTDAESRLNMEQMVTKYQELENEIKALKKEYTQGLGGLMLDNGDLPLAYLMFLLRDSQNRYPRFLQQGVIMGLVDWLVENKSHPEAAKLLQNVVAVRADLIRSDVQLTFFEVRVPYGCSRKDYAVLLADVLHCSNPSLKYGDTEELLSRAEKEVPGVMDMLYACPLRLIDPANQQTLGFYRFEPYIHAMVLQYIKPLHTGKVISRYHEVDDRTRPLSSGLNLSLFRDTYAVIPTLFHEFQHFRGDRNEASVFLKTQLFSIRFYQRNKKANAKADGVFAQLTAMLGLPPAVEKRGELNALIERCYGKQVSVDIASKMANAEIEKLNAYIDAANQAETWCPEKKLPRFSDTEDKENRDLIWNIVYRFATVPKSITEQEFKDILTGKSRTLQDIADMPFSPSLEAISNRYGQKEGVDMWLNQILTMPLNASQKGRDVVAVDSLLREKNLEAADCYKNLQTFLFDKESHNPKSLPKYLRSAAKRALEMEDTVIRPQHLLYALLAHPTQAMKNAGIVAKK